MTSWQRWVRRPQSWWARKLVAQIHLWMGIGVGFYVLLISISGSALVFRREFAGMFARKVTVVAEPGGRMSLQELRENVRRIYPAYDVYSVNESERADRPDEIVLGGGNRRLARLFDPYTGADLGDPQSGVDRAFGWLVDLHDNLLSGLNGRLANGIGASCVAALSITGMVIWWPGIKNWRRSLAVNRKAKFARFNWDLHSATGFWCSVFVLLWGISGVCLCFPGVLNAVVPS